MVEMRTGAFFTACLLVSLFSVTLGSVVTSVVAVSSIIRVPEDYPTIQAAVNAASPGDAILVASGTYYEHVVVNKSLTLMGENSSTTIVNGSASGIVFHVTANNVSISNLCIWNGKDFQYCHGVYLNNTFGSYVSNNRIFAFVGVEVYKGSHNTIVNNIIDMTEEIYVLDNNLLATSEASNGSDVEDYYKLEQTLVPICECTRFSLYPLQIQEFEQEHSYLDQARLLAVDHDSDVNIAVTPDGEILTYREPEPPIWCVDNNGTDRLAEILQMDGDVSNPTTYFYGEAGDYLILNFGQVDSGNAKLILRDDMKCLICCIEVQVIDNHGDWKTVSLIAPRQYWSIEAVDLSQYVIEGEDFLVRLIWTSPHRLDYVGLDTTPQESFTVHYANPALAVHSSEGNVRRKLLANDDVYAELTPGQHITLVFKLPNNPNEETTFILYTEGHYHTISD